MSGRVAASLMLAIACNEPGRTQNTPGQGRAAAAPVTAQPPAAETGLARFVPDVGAGFTASAVNPGEGFVRRDYSKNGLTIDVTVVDRPMSAGGYGGWSEQAGTYPGIQLDPKVGVGFFSCAGDASNAPCDLHVQFKAGYHLEIMGGGHATQAELKELFQNLPIQLFSQSR